MSQTLSEKHRPQTFEDVIGNEIVIRAIKALILKEELPHMLFYGPPGTGKTTTIRIIARKLYKTPHLHVLELNASDDRGIQVVRESIKSFASTTMSKQLKLVILDEADSMSRDAQNALRRIIEDFSTNTRFCFIANYSSKIIPAILSRCCKFRFGPVTSRIEDRVLKICREENIKIDEEGLKALIDFSDGDMRRLMNNIEGMRSSFKMINKKNVLNFSGSVDDRIYKRLFEDLCTKGFDELVEEMDRIINGCMVDCESILKNVSTCVRKSSLRNKMKVIRCLGDIEYRLGLGCSQSIQSRGIVGIFVAYRD